VETMVRKEIVREGKTGFVLERPKKFKWNKIEKIEKNLIGEKVQEL